MRSDKPARELDREQVFPKGTFDLNGPKINVLVRDKISFVGVAYLTRGGRSCSWALYRLKYSYTLHLSHTVTLSDTNEIIQVIYSHTLNLCHTVTYQARISQYRTVNVATHHPSTT